MGVRSDRKMILKANIKPPKNESTEHFFLKQIAKIWLKVQKQCQYVASEVYLVGGNYVGREARIISDAVGVRKSHSRGDEYAYTVYNVEVKVSKPDYLTGFNTSGHYNWIINDLPDGIGLIEVDIHAFTWVNTHRPILKGVSVVKKSARQNIDQYVIDRTLDEICRRLTNDDVFNNPWVRCDNA